MGLRPSTVSKGLLRYKKPPKLRGRLYSISRKGMLRDTCRQTLVRLNVPWNIFVASTCAGYVCWSSRWRPIQGQGGKNVFFGESWTTTPLGHEVFRCEHWKDFRVKFRCLDQSITLGQFLSLPLDDESFQQLAAWALQIYNSTKDFWKHRRSFCILLP